MNTENNNLLREFIGKNNVKLVIPFSYELGEELPTSNNIATLDNVEDEIRLEIEHGIVNEIEVFIKQLDFDNDYNLLMEVVEEIENTRDKEGNYFDVTIDSTGCVVDMLGEVIICVNTEEQSLTKRQQIYKMCVEFAKWYKNYELTKDICISFMEFDLSTNELHIEIEYNCNKNEKNVIIVDIDTKTMQVDSVIEVTHYYDNDDEFVGEVRKDKIGIDLTKLVKIIDKCIEYSKNSLDRNWFDSYPNVEL